MMKVSEIKRFRQNRANELDKLYEVLLKNLHIDSNDIMPIKMAAKQIKATVDDNSTIWGYSISNLILPINTTKHIIPIGLKARLKINCSLQSDISKWEKIMKYPQSFVIFLSLFMEILMVKSIPYVGILIVMKRQAQMNIIHYIIYIIQMEQSI